MKKKLTTNIDYFKYAQKKLLKGTITELIFGIKLKKEKVITVDVSTFKQFDLILLAN